MELCQALPRLDPRILGKINREILVTHDAEGTCVSPVAVPGDQFLERLQIPPLGPVDQLRFLRR